MLFYYSVNRFNVLFPFEEFDSLSHNDNLIILYVFRFWSSISLASVEYWWQRRFDLLFPIFEFDSLSHSDNLIILYVFRVWLTIRLVSVEYLRQLVILWVRWLVHFFFFYLFLVFATLSVQVVWNLTSIKILFLCKCVTSRVWVVT